MNFSKRQPPKIGGKIVSGKPLTRSSRGSIALTNSTDDHLIIVDEFSHIHRKFGTEQLTDLLFAAFYERKELLQKTTWKESKNPKSDKNTIGSRVITKSQIKLALPASAVNLMSEEKYKFAKKGLRGFKYKDKSYCMVGLRVQEKFYIFWIDNKKCDIYDH